MYEVCFAPDFDLELVSILVVPPGFDFPGYDSTIRQGYDCTIKGVSRVEHLIVAAGHEEKHEHHSYADEENYEAGFLSL